MRKTLKKIIGIIVIIFIGIMMLQSATESRSLAKLKQSDPNQYLSQLKETNEIKWLIALKELKPEQYDGELRSRIKAAQALPASQLAKNLEAYKRLARLEPDNQVFIDKVAYYKNHLKLEKARDERCNDSEIEAYQKAGQLVKTQLKSPRTAKLSSYGQSRITLYKGCEYQVLGFVDAQNSFGALIRSNYKVHMKRTETGWLVKDIQVN